MQGHEELKEFKQWALGLWAEHQQGEVPLVKPFRAQHEEGRSWYGDDLYYYAALFPKSEFPDFQSFRLYLKYLEPVLGEVVLGDTVDWQYLKTMRQGDGWSDIREAFSPQLVTKEQARKLSKSLSWPLPAEIEWSLELNVIKATAFEPMDTFLIVADTEEGYLWLLAEGHVTLGSRSRYAKYLKVIDGPDKGFSRELRSVARLGRSQDLEVSLQDPQLSEHHATLEVWDGRVFMADINACIELANEQCFKVGSNTFSLSWERV